MDGRNKSGHDAESVVRTSVRFTFQTANASPPCFFAAPGAPSSLGKIRIARKRTEGARDARGPKGPTGLDASRHRGLSKSCASPLALVRARTKQSASPPKPKASRARCLVGLLREIPGSRAISGPQAHTTVEDQAHGRRPSDRVPTQAIRALGARRPRAGTLRGLDRRALSQRISAAGHVRPPLPAPRLETLTDTPRQRGGMSYE